MSNENTARLRRWAESVLAMPAGHHDGDMLAAADHILATTDPLTMADVEWDDKHFLAGATINEGDSAKEMVMCGFTRDGEIYVVEPNPGRGKRGYWPMPGDLTPNGKRYELVEVTDEQDSTDTPTHPATLTTEQDYANAPKGTIVDIDGTVAVHAVNGWCFAGLAGAYSSYFLFHQGEGEVIRWGEDGEPCEPTVSSNENVGADQPEHPETLTTVEDYENAPEGTIVALNGCFPYVKRGRDDWSDVFGDTCSDKGLAGPARKVLRWGWGE